MTMSVRIAGNRAQMSNGPPEYKAGVPTFRRQLPMQHEMHPAFVR